MAVFVQNSRIAFLVFALFVLAGEANAAPKRIVSTSLCGDAYVLALARPQNITALSWQADTKLSAAPKPLRQKNRGLADAERLAALEPDLIVMGPGDAPRAGRAAKRSGTSVFSLNWVEDFSGVFANLEALGVAIGQEDAAQHSINVIKMRLEAMKAHNRKRPLRVLYLTPNGTSAGAGVFVDQAILAAGGINHGATLGVVGWGRVPLEKLVLDPPDLILTSFFNEGYASVANLRSRHPLFRQVLRTIPTVTIAAKNWVCAGPLLINAAEDIADVLDKMPKDNDT